MNGLAIGQSACFVEYERRRFIVREHRIVATSCVNGVWMYRREGFAGWYRESYVHANRPDAVAEANRLNATPAPEGTLR